MNTCYTKSLSGFGLLAGALLSQSAFAKPTMSSGTMSGPNSGTMMSGSHTMMSGAHSISARTQMTGTITKVRGMMMMVKPSTGSRMAKSITVPRTAKIMMGSKTGMMSGLKAGQKVRVMMTGGKVTRVDVMGSGMMSSHMSSGHMTGGSMMSGKSGGTMSAKPKM